jgi:hypothetical protein
MKIAADKCTAFKVVTTRDSWYIKNTHLYLEEGKTMPSSAADGVLRYIGGYITPWGGLQYRDLTEQLK